MKELEIDNLKKELGKIDFMRHIGDINPFNNDNINEQILLDIFQVINKVFKIEKEELTHWNNKLKQNEEEESE